MCEFCLKHGEGKKWYLSARNYSEDLLSDVRRREMIREFFADPGAIAEQVRSLTALEQAPGFVKRAVAWRASSKAKKVHYGQVVPIEEIERILELVNSVVRVACICRHITTGKEKRFCFGVSMGPNGGGLAEILRGLDGSFLTGPGSVGLETVGKDEALALMKDLDREGLCHTVWTFRTPFIGGICNCDRADCLAMQATVTHEIPVMFRAEYVAEVDADACGGCRDCQRVCPFGALSWSMADEKVSVDQRHCWGCGVCRSACPTDAIHLLDRAQVPVAARVW